MSTWTQSGLALAGALCALALLSVAPGVAQAPMAPPSAPVDIPANPGAGPPAPVRPDAWSLKIGAPIAEQPTDYQEYACGTNGGPPGRRLTGFSDFAQCKPDPDTGLFEVQFRYDDELEYWALAIGVTAYAEKYGGTDLNSYPVIVSGLFDKDGILRGWRAATDDRVELRIRRSAFQLSNYVRSRLGKDLWTCTELPVLEGETPFASRLIKENCRATLADGTHAFLETRLVRRKGQRMVDEHSGEVRGDRFVSTSRVLMLDPSITVADTMGNNR